MSIKNKESLKIIYFLNFFTLFAELKFFNSMRTVFFAISFGGSYTFAAALISTTVISSVITDIPLGYFSDRAGRKRTLQLGSLFSLIGVCFYLTNQKYFFIIGAIFEGIGIACIAGNIEAMLYDATEKNRCSSDFTKNLGTMMSYYQLGLIIISIGSLVVFFSPLWLVLLSIPFQILNVIIASRIPEIKCSASEQKVSISKLFYEIRKRPRMITIGIINSIDFSINEVLYYFRSAFIESIWPLVFVGLSTLGSSILGYISFRISSNVINRFGEVKTLIMGSILGRSLDSISLSLSNIASPVIIGLSSIFFGTTTVSQMSLLQNSLPGQFRSSIPAIFSTFGNILFSLFSLIFGVIADNNGITFAISIFISLSILTNIFYLKIKKT